MISPYHSYWPTVGRLPRSSSEDSILVQRQEHVQEVGGEGDEPPFLLEAEGVADEHPEAAVIEQEVGPDEGAAAPIRGQYVVDHHLYNAKEDHRQEKIHFPFVPLILLVAVRDITQCK